MLKGLLKPDLNSREASDRLVAIEKLGKPLEHQSELAELVQNDSAEEVRLAALLKLSDTQLLGGLVKGLIDQSDSQVPNVLSSALRKQFVSVLQAGGENAKTEKLQELLASGSPECVVLVACACNEESVRSAALAGIDDEQQIARIVCEAHSHSARLAAAEKLQQPQLMQTCLGKIKKRDKVAARHLQQRLDALQREVEKVELHQASVKQTTEGMKTLSESVWSPQYAGQFAALKQRWEALDPSPTDEEKQTYEKYSGTAHERVGAFKSQQARLDRCRDSVEALKKSVADLEKADLAGLAEAASTARKVADSAPEDWKNATDGLEGENAFANDYKKVGKEVSARLALVEPMVALGVSKLAAKKEAENTAKKEKTDSTAAKSLQAINKALADPTFESRMASVPELREKLGTLSQQAEKDQHRQTQLVEGLGKQLNAFSATIAAGKWGPAEGMGQRIGRKLEQISGKEKQSLQGRFESQRKKLDELADWQDFASKPKLEELVKSMQELPSQSLKPRPLADEIKALQNQWKELGNSRVANQLWPDFKEAGDTAYLPCKEYFEGLKKQREARVKNRTSVCERLEAFIAGSGAEPVTTDAVTDSGTDAGTAAAKDASAVVTADAPAGELATNPEKTPEKATENAPATAPQSAMVSAVESKASAKVTSDTSDWKAMQRLLSDAQREWRNNQPGGRKQSKSLEARYNSAVSRIENLIAPHFEAGETERREIIEKTRKLAENEINQHAINQAKRLQAAWKLCGPASRKEDRNLWTEFNELCGQIFGKHREDQRAQFKASMAHVDRAREIIKTIRSLGKNATDQDEKQFSDLQDEFRNLAEFPEKLQKGLLRDFRSAGDGYSAKRSSLGKKQEQQELESMRQLAQICAQLETGVLDFRELQSVVPTSKPDVASSETAAPASETVATGVEAPEDSTNESATADESVTTSGTTSAIIKEGETSDSVSTSSENVESATSEPEAKEQSESSNSSSPETASVDDVDSWSGQWEELALRVPKPWLKRITKRRSNACAILEKGDTPFNDKNNDARRLHCIKLEIARDVETPADDKALRMQFQLEQLQSGPDSALRDTSKELLRNHEVDWLCMPPASPEIAATLEQRFQNALGS